MTIARAMIDRDASIRDVAVKLGWARGRGRDGALPGPGGVRGAGARFRVLRELPGGAPASAPDVWARPIQAIRRVETSAGVQAQHDWVECDGLLLLSFVRRESALGPSRLVRALESGGRSVLSVAATTATAGIIVGVVTLTGLGLKLAGLIVALAGGSLLLTVTYSALAVWMLGLAVPVTAWARRFTAATAYF